MKKFLTFAAATCAASFISVSAHATTVDFVEEAAGNERGVESGAILDIGGISIQLNSNFNPYFDDVLPSGAPGGLGVCQVLDGNECDPSDDDNITVGEYVELVFLDGALDLTSLSFNDGDHNSLDADNVSQVSIIINDGAAMILTFADAVQMAAAGTFEGVSSIRFDFVDTDFYIDSLSSVPIPGAIPLLLSGIAGLGFASRKKKKA